MGFLSDANKALKGATGFDAGGIAGLALTIAEIENERRAAREETRALKKEAAETERQGRLVLEENRLRGQRSAASQRAALGATGLNVIGTGADGAVVLDTLTEALRRQRLIQDRTQTQVDRLLRRGAAIRRSANRGRILGIVAAFVEAGANAQEDNNLDK